LVIISEIHVLTKITLITVTMRTVFITFEFVWRESQNRAATKIALLTVLLRKLYLFETLWSFFFLDAFDISAFN